MSRQKRTPAISKLELPWFAPRRSAHVRARSGVSAEYCFVMWLMVVGLSRVAPRFMFGYSTASGSLGCAERKSARAGETVA